VLDDHLDLVANQVKPCHTFVVSPSQDKVPTGVIEDYVKAIYHLEDEAAEDAATTSMLAARLGVTASSASAMVKRLDAMGLATHARYRGVRLTEPGRRLALSVVRRHRLLELFLVESLGLSWDKVHDEAEVLEHALSPQLEKIIAAKLGDPDRDPHGDPIPTADGRVFEEPMQRLAELAPGETGELVRVSDTDPEMLRYLTAKRITLGNRIEVVERQPFGGSVSARINGELHALGSELAAAMRVRVLA